MYDHMDTEEFYDSLEEEFSSASSSSIPLAKPHQNSEVGNAVEFNADQANGGFSADSNLSLIIIKPVSHIPIPHTPRSSTSSLASEFRDKCSMRSTTNIPNDISSIVPLYGGDRTKSEIRRSRRSSSSPVLHNKKTEAFGKSNFTSTTDADFADKNRNHRQKRRSRIARYKHKQSNEIIIEPVGPKNPSKSYLSMFRARIGYPGAATKKEPEDTVRSLFGDSHRTDITEASSAKDEFMDAEDDKSDTTSFYLNHIEESERSKASGKYTPNHSVSHTSISSMVGLDFKSISAIIASDNMSETSKSSTRRRKSKLLPVPILGGLGPDIGASYEKLELRQRQLKYGQKVSYRNRIKLMEINVLKNLKNEIKESNSIDDQNI